MMGAPLKGIGPPHATVHPTPAMPSLSMGASSRYGANSPLNRGGAQPDVERHPPPVARSLVGLLALTGLKDALAEFDVPAGMDPDEEQYASWMVLWMPDARPPRVLIHQYMGRCFVEEEDLACALNESRVAAHPDRARMHPNWREWPPAIGPSIRKSALRQRGTISASCPRQRRTRSGRRMPRLRARPHMAPSPPAEARYADRRAEHVMAAR